MRVNIILNSITKKDLIKSLLKAGLDELSTIRIYPEFFFKEIEFNALVDEIREIGFSDLLVAGFSENNVNKIIAWDQGILLVRPKSVGFCDEFIEFAKPAREWIISYAGIKLLPLICYEIYFPHFPVFFGDVDLVTWCGTLQTGQLGWFKKLIKVRSMDFFAPIAGTIYPRRKKNSGIYQLSFIVYPENSIRNDIWSEKPFLIKTLEINRMEKSSHRFKAEDIFRKRIYGPFKKDIDENLFDIVKIT